MLVMNKGKGKGRCQDQRLPAHLRQDDKENGEPTDDKVAEMVNKDLDDQERDCPTMDDSMDDDSQDSQV